MKPVTAIPASDIEILLVEDNPYDAEMTLRVLEKHHVANRLVWLKDGAEALDFIFGEPRPAAPAAPARVPSRVILLDLNLPKIGGLDVLRRLKSDPRTRSVPVVVLTSSREEQDVVESYQAGVNSYIVKPVNFDDFAEVIARFGFYWLALNHPPEPASAGAE
jgi:CheY-like chemotaxis protein